MNANNRISNLVASQLPFFVRNDHENFVRFMEAYYEWLERSDRQANTKQYSVVTRAKNILSYQDVDQSIDEFTEELYKTFLKSIPRDALVDKNMLLKNVKDFYRARGTEKSIEFLMRILYNIQETDFYYPKKDILRASDGKWFIEKSLKFSDVLVDNVFTEEKEIIDQFIGREIVGLISGARASVERIDTYYEGETLVREFKISNQTKDFTSGEQVQSAYVSDGITRTIKANTFSGIINSVTLIEPGTLYQVGDLIEIESNTGSGGIIRVDSVTRGNIAALFVELGGSGYRANDIISIADTTGVGATANVLNVKSDGTVHPNSYNICISFISQEANTNVLNTAVVSSAYETFAYQNLNIISINTSSLRVNTGAGASVQTINLSGIKETSNVFFETYDSINVNNKIVLITSSNAKTNTITVSPGLDGNLRSNTLIILKRANSNTTIANAIATFVYGNTGPVRASFVISSGSGYSPNPSFDTQANTRIAELGILGELKIVNGGEGYRIGDTIEFINVLGGYGTGAYANVTNVNRQAANAINEVRWVGLPGHPVGGSGYDQNYLPRANVRSSNTQAFGANVVVRSVLGFGAEYRAVSSSLGQIEKLTIVSGGSGYKTAPTLNLTSRGDGTAQAVATIVTGAFIYPGRWLNDDGHISSYNFLQNRDYYQNFSYVIKTKASLEKYRKALKDMIHPAGLKLFGEYMFVDDSLSSEYDASIRSSNTTTGTIVMRSYVSTLGNVSVRYPSHGYTALTSNVYIDFVTGGLVSNTFLVRTANTNYFSILHSNTTNTSGNTIVFSL